MKNQIFENFEYRLTTAFTNDRCCVEVSYLWNGRPTKRLIIFSKDNKVNYINEAKAIIQNEMNNGQLLRRSKQYHRVRVSGKPILVTLLSLSFVAAVVCATIFTYQHFNGGTGGGGGGGVLPPGTEVEVKPDVIDPSGGKYEVSFTNTTAIVGEAYETKINLKQKNADATYILPNELRKVTSNTTELTKAQYTYTLNSSKTSADFRIEGQYVYGPVDVSLMLVAPEVETIKLSFKGNDCTGSLVNTNEDAWDWERNVEKGKPVTINVQTPDSYHLGDFKKTVTITNKEAAGEFTYTGFGENKKAGSITFTAPTGDFGVTVSAIKDISDVTITLKDELKNEFILRDSDNQQIDTIYVDDTHSDYTCYVESTKTKIVDNLAISVDEQPVAEGWTYDFLSHALTINKELIAEPHEIVITEAQSMYSVTFVDDYGTGLTIDGVDVSDTFVTFDSDADEVTIEFDQNEYIDSVEIQSIYVGDIPVQQDDFGHQYGYILTQPDEGEPSTLTIFNTEELSIANDIRVVFNYSTPIPKYSDRITLVYDRRSAPKDEKGIDGVSFALDLEKEGEVQLPLKATINWGDGSEDRITMGDDKSIVMHNFTKQEKSIITITSDADPRSPDNKWRIKGLELVDYLTASPYEQDTDIYAQYITKGNAYITAATIDASELEVMQFADCNLNTYYYELGHLDTVEVLENAIHMIEPSHSHLERITFSYNTKYIPFGCCFNCPMLKEVNVSGLDTSLFGDYSGNGLQNAITADYIDGLAFANTFKENTGKLNRLSLIDTGLISSEGTEGTQEKIQYAFANCPYVTLINYDDDYSNYVAYIVAEATDIITPFNILDASSVPPIYDPYRNLIYRTDDGKYDALEIASTQESTSDVFLIRYTGNNETKLTIPITVGIKGVQRYVRGFGGPNFLNPVMKKTIQEVGGEAPIKQIFSGTFDGASSLSIADFNFAEFIGARAFRGTALEDVTLSIFSTSIEAETFADCLKLKSVNFEYAVALTSIGCLAFNNCPLLAASEDSDRIVIPNTILYIMAGAFGGNNIAKDHLVVAPNNKYLTKENTVVCHDFEAGDLAVSIVAATPYSDFSKIGSVTSVCCGAAYNITFADECNEVVLDNWSDHTVIQLFAFKGAHMHSFEIKQLETSLAILSNAFENVTLDEAEEDNRTLVLPNKVGIYSYAFANSDFDTIIFSDGEDYLVTLYDCAFINSNVKVIDLTGIIDYWNPDPEEGLYSLVAYMHSINSDARIKVNNLEQANMLMGVTYIGGIQGWPLDIDRYIIE